MSFSSRLSQVAAVSSSGSATSSFKTIQTPAGTSPVATSPTDTLTLTSTDGTITITGNAGTDTVNFAVNLSLDGLNNVTAPSPSAGEVLTWNGSAWVNAASGASLWFNDSGNTKATLTGGIVDLNGNTLADEANGAVKFGNDLDFNSYSGINIGQLYFNDGANSDITTDSTGEIVVQPNGTRMLSLNGNYYNVVFNPAAGNSVGGTYQTCSGGAGATMQSSGTGSYSTVSGGYGGVTDDANYAVVGGGYQVNAYSDYATGCGGYQNYSYGQYSFNGGGEGNESGSQWGVVCGGYYNQSYNGDAATVGGGKYNVATGNFAVVPGGFGANAPRRGEFAHGADYFDGTAGTAQTGTFHLTAVTTDNTQTEMFLDGASGGNSARIVIDTDYALSVWIDIVALGEQVGPCAAWTIGGIIRNLNGTMQFIGRSIGILDIGSNFGGPPTGWATSATYDDTNKSLQVLVTGDNSSTQIHWSASVRYVQVHQTYNS